MQFKKPDLRITLATEEELNKLATITEEDILSAQEAWEQGSPTWATNLLLSTRGGESEPN